MKIGYKIEPLNTGGFMVRSPDYDPLIIYGETEKEALEKFGSAFQLYYKYHTEEKKDFVETKYLEVDVS